MMKKKVVLAAPVPLQNVDGRLDWELCCICQEPGGKPPVCPAKNPNKPLLNSGYNTFAENVETLRRSYPCHLFPCGRKPENYAEGCGVKDTLVKNKAIWHKKCVMQYTTKFSVENLSEPTLENSEDRKEATTARTRSSSVAINPKEEVCFICKKKPTKNELLHRSMTERMFNSIKDYATKANDTHILAFLSVGDLVAQEAKYHSCCVLKLYNKGQALPIHQEESEQDAICENLAFADLLLYMHSQLQDSNRKCAFNTATLMKLYNDRLSQLLGNKEKTLPELHNSRFREKILRHFPELRAMKSGREYVLMVENTNILHNIHDSNEELDALAVNRFVRNIRKNVLAKEIRFTGNFEPNCEENCIPPSLLALVNMILYGSSISTECRTTQPAITVSQIMIANMRKRSPNHGSYGRQDTAREPPFLLYLGLSIYGSSRDKSLIDNLHRRGLSVSSNRIYELTSTLASHVVQRAEEEGVVCPSVLQKDLFTVGALDNIDVKPSSTTSRGEFHGTGISLFQLPLNGEVSSQRTLCASYEDVAKPGIRHVPTLPASYSDVPEFTLPNVQPPPPTYSSDVFEKVIHLAGNDDELWYGEGDWLDHVHNQLVEREEILLETISWSSFRATRQGISPLARAKNALLPLFHEKSTSPAMVKHGMDKIKESTDFLNSGQISAMCVDEPLFALAKAIQWNFPEKYGERQFVLLFGPLHIEQNFLRLIGQVMEGSGWTGIVANSGILPAGSAEGLLKVSSITKSRLFHEYTAAALFSLLTDAYNATHPSHDVTKEEWLRETSLRSPTFRYWLLVLRLELLLLKFVRSLREARFEDFKQSIILMLPWLFSVGHFLYARWLTVHAFDLVSLEKNVPEMHRRFSMGAFVVRKTSNAFSCIGVDHAHEQNNAGIKSRGGASGLTQDPSALRRWTIAGTEVTRLLTEFEGEGNQEQETGNHHEQYPKFQERFFECCVALKESFVQSENPFMFTGPELINLETRVEIDKSGLDILDNLERQGVDMLDDFIEKRLKTRQVSFYTAVKKPKFQIFYQKKPVQKSTIAEMKSDIQLFSRLFIVSLSRSLDLDLFFAHENQACPPSLSSNGKLRTGQKRDLIPILQKIGGNTQNPTTCDGIILDGAAIVRFVKVEGLSSFPEFSNEINKYCIKSASRMTCQRVDIPYDKYNINSLKSHTRESRGTAARRPGLIEKGTFPNTRKQWDDYLKNDGNKEELFKYLAEKALTIANLQIVTNVKDVIRVSDFQSQGSSLDNVRCDSMEEADGRIFLHAIDMVQHGSKIIVIRCSDADILVLGVSFFHSLQKIGLKELWIHICVGDSRKYVAAHAIALSLGEDRSTALRGFHAFSGCDTVSYFCGKGKRSAWAAWSETDEEFTEAFKSLGAPTSSLPTDKTISVLERFVVTMYGAKEPYTTAVSARKHLFGTVGKPLLHIPPSLGVIIQHTRRAAYQAGQIWGRSMQKDWEGFPSPAGWGWKNIEGKWTVHWTDLDDIWKSSRDLSVCGCNDCSKMWCTCRKAGVTCALSCKKCKGTCANSKKGTAEEEDDNEDVDGDLQQI